MRDQGHTRIYKTDRLGMPLIDTVTGPDMRTPHEAAEVGQIIRRLTRSTGKVRTGIGAAREDVNVSITGGTRVEIKGVPRIPLIPILTYEEAMRQASNPAGRRAKLMKPGPSTTILAIRPAKGDVGSDAFSFLAISSAMARGAFLASLARRIGRLVERSPNFSSRGASNEASPSSQAARAFLMGSFVIRQAGK